MNDFDFLVGSWDVANRRLTKRLAGSDEWEQFPATSECVRLFDGAANLDEIRFPTRGFSGLSLRLYDPHQGLWAIYWANSGDGRLQPPVAGRIAGGRGEFYGDDTHDGTPVRVRYVWSDITATSARWEQAFSVDDGRAWETNWIMEFTRR
jgi:hypothetical protein